MEFAAAALRGEAPSILLLLGSALVVFTLCTYLYIRSLQTKCRQLLQLNIALEKENCNLKRDSTRGSIAMSPASGTLRDADEPPLDLPGLERSRSCFFR